MEKAEKQGNKAFIASGKACARPIILGAVIGILTGVGMLCLLAAILGATHMTRSVIPIAAMVVAAAAGFFAGFAAAKIHKKHGLLMGGFSALTLAVGILAVSWILSGVPEASLWTRTLLMTVAGMIGGVLGVGKKGQPY